MPKAIAHHKPTIHCPTCGVKYRPNAAPITHCPPLRSANQLTVGAPSTDTKAVASSGPIIQGMGVPSQTQSWAASQASPTVAAARKG